MVFVVCCLLVTMMVSVGLLGAPPTGDASPSARPGPAANYLSAWSSITANTCDGSYGQKWNAPPLPAGGNLSGERETTGGR